jgi:hypothetical protein
MKRAKCPAKIRKKEGFSIPARQRLLDVQAPATALATRTWRVAHDAALEKRNELAGSGWDSEISRPKNVVSINLSVGRRLLPPAVAIASPREPKLTSGWRIIL